MPDATSTDRRADVQQSWTSARARHAALRRDRPADDPEVMAALADLRVARLADHVREVVDSAPAPTPAQIERLRGLLPAPRGGGAA